MGLYTQYRFGWSTTMIGASLALVGVLSAISQASVLELLVPKVGERAAGLLSIGVMVFGFVGSVHAKGDVDRLEDHRSGRRDLG